MIEREKYMSFAEEFGFAPAKAIQIDGIDSKLRNRLYNLITDEIKRWREADCIYEIFVDQLGGIVLHDYHDEQFVKLHLLNKDGSNWYDIYEILNLYFSNVSKLNDAELNNYLSGYHYMPTQKYLNWFANRINQILEEEKSGYRIVNNRVSKITDKEEIESIEDSISNPYGAVGIHIKKALELYSDREKPDYENSIKESISAVESMCCVITGESGAQATLGRMLKHLEEKGITIHSAQKEAFSKLYGFTSDVGGIRHGSIDYTNATSEDALYMLISCSAFVNYLKAKYEQIQ